MKTGLYIGLIAFALFSVKCDGGAARQRYVRTTDSLAGVVGSLANQLRDVDTIALEQMMGQYSLCMSFINQHVSDTLNMEEGEQLQRFSVSGRQLEAFAENRTLLLSRASAILSQLRALGTDVAAGALATDEMAGYAQTELTNVGAFAAQASEELRLYHSAVKQFNLSVSAVAGLVRRYNQGQWPAVIADTSARL